MRCAGWAPQRKWAEDAVGRQVGSRTDLARDGSILEFTAHWLSVLSFPTDNTETLEVGENSRCGRELCMQDVRAFFVQSVW